jgi:hypothetical protein
MEVGSEYCLFIIRRFDIFVGSASTCDEQIINSLRTPFNWQLSNLKWVLWIFPMKYQGIFCPSRYVRNNWRSIRNRQDKSSRSSCSGKYLSNFLALVSACSNISPCREPTAANAIEPCRITIGIIFMSSINNASATYRTSHGNAETARAGLHALGSDQLRCLLWLGAGKWRQIIADPIRHPIRKGHEGRLLDQQGEYGVCRLFFLSASHYRAIRSPNYRTFTRWYKVSRLIPSVPRLIFQLEK